MKYYLLLLIFFPLVSGAQTMNGNLDIFDLGDFKLHIYTSAEAMADVSAIIEGEKELVVLEQPSFYKSIEEFNLYAKSLNKPVAKVIADYHTGGLSDYPGNKIVMVKGMPEFEKGEIYSGMMQNFARIFGEAMDVRPHKKAKTIVEVNSIHTWAGIDFIFTPGVKSDFPAASITIGNKAYYSHFAPVKAHFNTMRIKNRTAVDEVLEELKYAKSTGSEIFFGSHGIPAKMDAVDFQIEYLECVKTLLNECKDPDIFGQRLMAAYPHIEGASGIKALSKALYPEEPVNEDKENIKILLGKYMKSVSDIDKALAKTVWADTDEISVINGMGQFFGMNSIFDDFIIKAFSGLPERKISSLSEIIHVYGDMAYVQFYWAFDITEKDGKAGQRRGRETMICRKVNNEWKIYHIHYSGMPMGLVE